MKRIAIVTLYGDYNIGNKLQNFAVQKILEGRGYTCETLPYTLYRYANKKKSQKIKLYLKALLLKFHLTNINAVKIYDTELRRQKKFREFSSKYLHISSEKVNYKHIPAGLADKYDLFVVGSDQVWHNWSGTESEIEFYLLSFVPSDKRIALAPSFGMDHIDKFQNIYMRELDKFNYLSCREQSGINLIYEMIGRRAELLIDPTMALSTQEWKKLECAPEYTDGKPYILVYFLGGLTPLAKEKISNIASNNQLAVIDIYNETNLKTYFTGPDEFIYLIDHADLICTDSYHGCVFSILFHKPFICFKRLNDNDKMLNRLVTLLEKFNLINRFQEKLRTEDIFNIDYKIADAILNKERIKFGSFLDNSLSKVNNNV